MPSPRSLGPRQRHTCGATQSTRTVRGRLSETRKRYELWCKTRRASATVVVTICGRAPALLRGAGSAADRPSRPRCGRGRDGAHPCRHGACRRCARRVEFARGRRWRVARCCAAHAARPHTRAAVGRLAANRRQAPYRPPPLACAAGRQGGARHRDCWGRTGG